MDIPKSPGRKPRKQNKIADYLRKNIIDGVWEKGRKIPPRSALEKQFKVSSVTIQRTLTPLIKDGFLRVVPNRGTFVNEELPHILNFALVLPELFSGDSKNLYFRTLKTESQKLQKELGIKIIPYDDVLSPRLTTNAIKLIKDIRAERLAGIIFSTSVHLLKNSPILHEKDIPRVIIASTISPGMPSVKFNSLSFADLALDYMLSKGRKRIALISTSGQLDSFLEYFRKAIKKREMTFLDQWHQYTQLSAPEAAENIVHLLMGKFNSERPDGIIVSDDNLINAVCKGLKKAGTKVPKECEVVSLCNFPRSADFDIPVKFMGVDTRKLLKTAVDILQAKRDGKNVPEQTVIKACHEEDILQQQKKLPAVP